MEKEEITNISFTAIRPSGSLIGFASFVYNDDFYLGDIGVHLKTNGEISLAFPTKKIGETKIGIFHPVNSRTEEVIKEAVEEKVKKLNIFGQVEE